MGSIGSSSDYSALSRNNNYYEVGQFVNDVMHKREGGDIVQHEQWATKSRPDNVLENFFNNFDETIGK